MLLTTEPGDAKLEGLYGDGLDLPEPEDTQLSPPDLPALDAVMQQSPHPSPSPASDSSWQGQYGGMQPSPGGYGNTSHSSRDPHPAMPIAAPSDPHLGASMAPAPADAPVVDDMQDGVPMPAT